MATPVNSQNRTTPATATTPTAPVQRTTGGVGDAPDTLNSAAPPQPEGYIVPFLNWVCGWITWIFRKVFCCGSQTAAPATPTQPSPGAAPSNAPPAPVAAIPIAPIEREVQVWEAFEQMSERRRIATLQHIGREQARWWSVRPFEEIGRRAAVNDYRLLEQAMELPD